MRLPTCPSLRHVRTLATATAAAALLSLIGCTTAAQDARPAPTTALPVADSGHRHDAQLVALVDGRDAVDASTLGPALVEIAGQTALREALLDLRLRRRLADRAITVDAARIERERAVLLETLSDDAQRALELLGEIRARQGLGPVRFDALLRRNAGLRALVEREVTADGPGVEAMFDTLHGPRRTVRIAVFSSLADAQRFIGDLHAPEVPEALRGSALRFAELASERSLDASAARGGLLEPIARRDPSYPEPLRASVFDTAVGSASLPVLDGARFTVVFVVKESPADGTTLSAARERCERLLRLSRERLLMDALARELASLDGVTVFDRAYDPLPAR